MRKFTGDAITAVVFLLAIPAWAQPAGPLFDVASIKPVRIRTGSSSVMTPPGGYVARNQNILTVIASAFDLRTYRILGAPDWVKSERYDVEAKTDGGREREIQREGDDSAGDASIAIGREISIQGARGRERNSGL